MDKVKNLIFILGFTIIFFSLFVILLRNNILALGYMYTKYETEKEYSNLILPSWIDPSFDQRDYLIIPINKKLKESNQYKIQGCFNSYHNTIPKIHGDDESYREGSYVACTYGLYNYNVNIGNKNLDPFLRIQIEGGAELCMLDDHCMKKINKIMEGKIPLPR